MALACRAWPARSSRSSRWGSVLFPGLALPLHIFEERYRLLVARLSEGEDDIDRSFGVVAIRAGHEVGASSVAALHEVGTTALLRRVTPYPDGRSDIVSVGARRFRLHAVDALGLEPASVFKTLLAHVDAALVVTVLPVTCQLDLKALAAAAGGKRAALANEPTPTGDGLRGRRHQP